MRLGGFVLHGNNRDTLEAALESVCAVADRVVTVDSGSTDGSAALVDSRGVQRVQLPWQGYGAARAAAVQQLQDCDYVFFLDSDERLPAASIEALNQWKQSPPRHAAYRFAVEDWVEFPGKRFRLRTGWPKRVFRREVARWRPDQIVHEAIETPEAVLLPARVEHRFTSDLDVRLEKHRRDALLWAIQAHAHGQRGKWAPLQRPVQLLKAAVLQGGGFRGGLDGVRVAWAAAAYHAEKYRALQAIRRGENAELVELYRQGRYRELFLKVG